MSSKYGMVPDKIFLTAGTEFQQSLYMAILFVCLSVCPSPLLLSSDSDQDRGVGSTWEYSGRGVGNMGITEGDMRVPGGDMGVLGGDMSSTWGNMGVLRVTWEY